METKPNEISSQPSEPRFQKLSEAQWEHLKRVLPGIWKRRAEREKREAAAEKADSPE